MYRAEIRGINTSPGEHTIAIRVEDAFDNQAVEKVVVR